MSALLSGAIQANSDVRITSSTVISMGCSHAPVSYTHLDVYKRQVLKRTQEQKEADFERLMKAYLDGDVSKIVGLDEQITGGMLPKDLWVKMKVRLLDRRNKVMAERALQMAEEKPVFIAVGASHLGGEDGLVEAFKKAGYKLSPVAK